MTNFAKAVAAVWVLQDGDEMTLALDTVEGAVPYDRPQLARCLRRLADRLEELSAATDT